MKAGLIGKGISGSLTPSMHEAEGRALGLDYRYTRFDTTVPPWSEMSLAQILDVAERDGFSGVNITHPFKLAAAELAHDLVGPAKALGAINTLVFRDGRRIGHNTDYLGFGGILARDLTGAAFGEVLLVGAGGAGAAVALALIDHGADRLVILDRAAEPARDLADRLAKARPRADMIIAQDAREVDFAALDGAVNATPMGMDDHPGCAIDVDRLPSTAWVADIVYFPLETEMLARARGRGLRLATGARMAVFQAVGSFELFTGRSADPDRMTAHFDRLQRVKQGRAPAAGHTHA